MKCHTFSYECTFTYLSERKFILFFFSLIKMKWHHHIWMCPAFHGAQCKGMKIAYDYTRGDLISGFKVSMQKWSVILEIVLMGFSPKQVMSSPQV